MEEMFQALMDRSRSPLDVKKIKTILGVKRRGPAQGARRKKGVAWEVAVERPVTLAIAFFSWREDFSCSL